jgi:type IV pilus assembly protein PilY1
MKPSKVLHFVVGAAYALLAGVCAADDTDIYMNPGSGLPAGAEPMVMFSLDYRPNLAAAACQADECDTLIAEGYMPASGPYTFFDVLRGSLRKVFDPLQGVRVGLMLNHDNAANCAGPEETDCSNGGYLAMGFRTFYADDRNGAKREFHDILASIPLPLGSESHSYQGKELFFEFFRYLTGQEVYNGHNGWTDYNTNASENLDVDGEGYAWDPSIEADERYLSPLEGVSECTNIFTVNPLFFVANQEAESDTAIEAPIGEGGFGSEQREFTDVIRYLADADLADGTYGSVANLAGKQNVTSYFLVDPTKVNRTTIGYSRAGGTGVPLPLSANPDELVATFNEVFRQVLSVSTTFVAASVPVNVFNRADILDEVYIALFQVDRLRRPAWPGNLKKLRLSSIDGAPLLVDALDAPAIAGDGRIRPEALTYWTLPGSLPPPDATTGEVAGRDGRTVSRGGGGQRVPGFISGGPGLVNGLGGRRLFFDNGSSLAPLNADALTASALQSPLGAVDTDEALSLIAFARGMDIDDLDGDANVTEARSWIFNDPLHSKPMPINYGARGGYTTSNPAIFIAVASNDGVLHFIRNTTTGGAQSGQEVWGFMPQRSMSVVKTLRANGVSTPHPYTLDGSPTVYLDDRNRNGTVDTGEAAYLFIGMRRGGKRYYALDISDPENPQLLWTINKAGDFAELGYTFSDPRVGLVNLGSGPQPVLIFAGGYDVNKDLRGGVGTDDAEGNALFVVDARTGSLIWKARRGTASPTDRVFEHPDLADSIPSAVAVGDTDGDQLVDRVVVGDMGGNVWRADLAGSDTSRWKLSLLASLGRHAESGVENDRRFFHRPDIVQAQDERGPFDAVLIGSGDREDPLDVGGVTTNYFYMVKDRNTAVGSGVDTGLVPSWLGDVTDNCLQVGTDCTVDLTHGWKLQLELGGEKALSTPLTFAGMVFFTTYVPVGASNPCGPAEGTGRLYAVSLQNAASVVNYDTTDDDLDDPGVPTTTSDRSTDLNSPGIPSEVVAVPPNMVLRPDLQVETLNVDTRWRTFWYLEEDSDL